MAGNASLVPIFLGSVVCGALGSMLGLGGGVFIVPFLTLLMHLPFSETVRASIVSVIATSSGAAVAYLRDCITNLRIGMFLEVATTAGALTGACIEGIVPTSALIIFGLMLAASSPRWRDSSARASGRWSWRPPGFCACWCSASRSQGAGRRAPPKRGGERAGRLCGQARAAVPAGTCGRAPPRVRCTWVADAPDTGACWHPRYGLD
jgi:hypothetical protein